MERALGALSRHDKTNKNLLEALEGGSASLTADGLAEILERSHERFLKVLGIYKPPSKASLDKIKSGKIEIGGKTISIAPSEQTFVEKLSKRIDLDAAETFKIFHNFMKYEATGRFAYDSEASMREVIRYYYNERKDLLRCIAAIYRISQSDSPYCKATEKEASRLKNANHETHMLNQLVTLTEMSYPKDLEYRQDQEAWAINNLEEISLCLDILFIIHYNKEAESDFNLILKYGSLLKRHMVWNKVHSLLGTESRPLMNRICVQSIFILLVIWSNINLASEEAHGKPMQLLAEHFHKFEQTFPPGSHEPSHGPIFLAWACLCHYGPGAVRKDTITASQTYLYAARQVGVVPFLSEALRIFDRHNTLLTGYKNVVAQLLESAFVHFHFTDLGPIGVSEDQTLALLLKLHQDIYRNERAVCEFMLQTFDDPKRNALYHISRANFPYMFDPFIRVNISYASSPATVEQLCLRMLHMDRLTIARSQLPPNAQIVAKGEHRLIVRPIVLQGLTIPAETVGRANLVGDDELLQLVVKYSAWTYLVGKLQILSAKLSERKLTSNEDITHATLVLQLMDQVTNANPQFLTFLIAHLKQCFGDNFNLLRLLFTLLRKGSVAAASAPTLLDMLYACVRFINLFALHYPAQVWAEMRRGGVLHEMAASLKSTYEGDIRKIIELEQRNGVYPITITFLSLLHNLLGYAIQWRPTSKASLERQGDTMDADNVEESILVSLQDFHPCLAFIKTEVFARYESWRFLKPHQKNQIGTRILNIFIDILSCDSMGTFSPAVVPDEIAGAAPGGTPYRPLASGTPLRSPGPRATAELIAAQRTRRLSLKESLLQSLLDDRSFHKVLFGVVATGLRPLEKLKSQHRAKEARTLERLLTKSLNILARVLESKEALVQAGHVAATATSSLEHFLLSTDTTVSANSLYSADDAPGMFTPNARGIREVHLIQVIASYINWPNKRSDLPYNATKLLSLICGIKLDSGSGTTSARTPSLVGYLGTQAEAVRDAYMSKLNDPLAKESLREEILNLVHKALRYQPGLAMLFINIEASKLQEGKEEKNKHESHSCIKIMRKMLANYSSNLARYPRLFAKVLSLLASLWQDAPSHQSIIKVLRDSPDFWKQLADTVCASIEKHLHTHNTRSSSSVDDKLELGASRAKGKERLTETEIAHLPVTTEDVCYQVAIGAYALQILSQEIFHVNYSSDQLDASLREQLHLINTKQKQLLWFEEISRSAFSKDVLDNLKRQTQVLLRTTAVRELVAATPRSVLGRMEELGPQINDSDLDTILPRVDGERKYGVNYHYNSLALQTKLASILEAGPDTPSPATPMRNMPADVDARSFLIAIQDVNNMLSLVDVQQDLLHSWRSFIQATAIKQPSSSLLASPQASASLIQHLAAVLQSEERKGPVIDKRVQEMAELLLFLLQRHYYINSITRSKDNDGVEQPALFSGAKVASAVKEALLRRSITSDQNTHLISSFLGCLLVLVRAAQVNHGSAQKLSDALLSVLPQILALVERAEFGHTVLAILDALILKTKDKTRLYDVMSHLEVYSKMVAILHRSFKAIDATTEEAPVDVGPSGAVPAVQPKRTPLKTAELVVHLMLSISSDSVMAEALALAGVMRVMTNNSLLAFREMQPIYIDGKRNGWQRLWCLLLTLMTSMLREAFIDQAIQFLVIHHQLIARSIQQPAAPYTLAQLDEAEKVTALIYELGSHWKRWRFLRGKLADYYRDCLLMLVHNLVIALQSDQMSIFAQPVTKKQKMLFQPIIVEASKRKDDTSNEGEKKEKKSSKLTKTDMELRPFLLVVENRLFNILRNCLSFFRIVGPQLSPTLLVNQYMLTQVDWDAYKPLLTDRLTFDQLEPPLSFERSTTKRDDMLLDEGEMKRASGFTSLFGNPPQEHTLGLLVKGVFHVCANGIKDGLSREGRIRMLAQHTKSLKSQLSTTRLLSDTINRSLSRALDKICAQLKQHPDILYYLMQVSLYMILSHLVIFIHGKQKISDRTKVDLGMEMESFFGRLVRDLTHRKERGDLEASGDVKLDDYLTLFSGTKRYFEDLLNSWAASHKGMLRQW